MSELRKRMIRDMQSRNFSPGTRGKEWRQKIPTKKPPVPGGRPPGGRPGGFWFPDPIYFLICPYFFIEPLLPHPHHTGEGRECIAYYYHQHTMFEGENQIVTQNSVFFV